MEEALSDEVARAVLREVIRLPGRDRRIVLGIVGSSSKSGMCLMAANAARRPCFGSAWPARRRRQAEGHCKPKGVVGA
jgi:hypothetical protein